MQASHILYGRSSAMFATSQRRTAKSSSHKPSAKEICVTCHADKAEQIEKAKVQHPGAAAIARLQDPHAAPPGFPKPTRLRFAWAVTSEQAERARSSMCISPRSSRAAPLAPIRTATITRHCCGPKAPNPFCLECHAPDRKPQKLEGEHLSIFDGK